MARTRQKTSALSDATAGHWRWVAPVLAGLLFFGGCIHHHEKPAKPVCYPSGPCAGYYPTCWRRWSEECPACPVDLGAESGEKGAETVPLPQAEGQERSDEASTAPPNEMDLPPSQGEDAAQGNGTKTDGTGPAASPRLESPKTDGPTEDEDSRREGSKAKGPLVRNDRAAKPRSVASPQNSGKPRRTAKRAATSGALNTAPKSSGGTVNRSGPQASRGVRPIDGRTTKGKPVDRKLPAKPREDAKQSPSNVAQASRPDRPEPRKSQPDQTGLDAFPPHPRKLFSRFDGQGREGPTPTDKATVDEPVARLCATPRRESAATSATANSPSSESIAPQFDRRADESKATAAGISSPAVQRSVPQPTASTATVKFADRPRLDASGPRRSAPRKNDAAANAMTAGKWKPAAQARPGKGQQEKPTATATQPAMSKPIVASGDLRQRGPAATSGDALEKARPKSPFARFGNPGRDDSAASLKPAEPSKPLKGAIHADDDKPRGPAPSVNVLDKTAKTSERIGGERRDEPAENAIATDQPKSTPAVAHADDKPRTPAPSASVADDAATPAVRIGGDRRDEPVANTIATHHPKSTPPVIHADDKPRTPALTASVSDKAATPAVQIGGDRRDEPAASTIATDQPKWPSVIGAGDKAPYPEAIDNVSDKAAKPAVRFGGQGPNAATANIIATGKPKLAPPVVQRDGQLRDQAATVILSDQATTPAARYGGPGPVAAKGDEAATVILSDRAATPAVQFGAQGPDAAKAKIIATEKPKSGQIVHRDGQRRDEAATVFLSDQAATPAARFGRLGPDATTAKAIATPKPKSVAQREGQPRNEAATVMSDQAAMPTVRLGGPVPDAATAKAIATPKPKSAPPVVQREGQSRDDVATVMLSDKATTPVARSGRPGPDAAKAKVITTAESKSAPPVVHHEGQRSGHAAAAVSDQAQVIATTTGPGGQRQDEAPEMLLVTDRTKARKPATRRDAPRQSKAAAKAAAAPSRHASKHVSTRDDLGPRQDAEELDSVEPIRAWDTLKSKAGKLFTPRSAQ